MKIYNKKYFFLGLTAAVLAVLRLFRGGPLHAGDWLSLVLTAGLAWWLLSVSLNRQRSREAVIHDQDEREQLMNLKAYRTAFRAGVVLTAAAGYVLSMHGSPEIRPMAAGFLLSAVVLIAVYRLILLLKL